jgi:hypothetical protein
MVRLQGSFSSAAVGVAWVEGEFNAASLFWAPCDRADGYSEHANTETAIIENTIARNFFIGWLGLVLF